MFELKEIFNTSSPNGYLCEWDQTKNDASQGLWITQGHVFWGGHGKLYSSPVCNDFNSVTTHCKLSKTNSFAVDLTSPVLEIVASNNIIYEPYQVCFVISANGHVTAKLFNVEEAVWTDHSQFMLTNNSDSTLLTNVVFNDELTVAAWCCATEETSEHCVYVRKLTLKSKPIFELNLDHNAVKILSECPSNTKLGLYDCHVLCLPVYPIPIDSFLIYSTADYNLTLLNKDGKALYHSINREAAANLTDILISTIGLWKNTEAKIVFYCRKNLIYILNGKGNLLIFNRVVCDKINLANFGNNTALGMVAYANALCVFSALKIDVFSLSNGSHLETIFVKLSDPVLNAWHCQAPFTLFGFHTRNAVHQLLPLSVIEMLNYQNPAAMAAIHGDPDWDFLSKLSLIVSKKTLPFTNTIVANSKPIALQNEALLLNVMQYSRESGDLKKTRNTRFVSDAIKANEDIFVCSKVSKLVNPLVDSFVKLDDFRFKLLENSV